jgi:integral membrane protein
MPLAPKPESFPRIRSALGFYRVTSYITGVLLLLLSIEMLLKYVWGVEIELGGPFGLLALVPEGTATAVNLSTGILIVHGWFYVVYLIADFRLWSLMRWGLGRLLMLAAGGVVPFLSFFVEHYTHREVTGYLAARESELDPRAAEVRAATSDPTVEASH